MAFRPRVRMPAWAAVAVVAAAYLVRSAVRGWDFRPDLPLDAAIGGVLIGLVVLRTLTADWARRDETDDR